MILKKNAYSGARRRITFTCEANYTVQYNNSYVDDTGYHIDVTFKKETTSGTTPTTSTKIATADIVPSNITGICGSILGGSWEAKGGAGGYIATNGAVMVSGSAGGYFFVLSGSSAV